MKLSEMSTRQAAACMAELAAPIGAIAQHPTLKAWVDSAGDEKKRDKSVLQLLADLIPVLLRDNYDDTAAIIAALCGKKKEVVDRQPIRETVADVKESLDSDFFGFFH